MKRCELVRVTGQIDSVSGPELERTLCELIESGHRNLVINLRDVTFMASPGIKALLAAQVTARRRVPYGSHDSGLEETLARAESTALKTRPQGEVVLSEVPPRLRETLELVGLHHLFQFFDNDLEAVGSF
jgi:anti-anti-sigma regulatory factor